MTKFTVCLMLLVAGTALARAEDWPTYRGDAQRSGYTPERLPAQLSLAWSYHPLHPPVPAWPRDDRMWFDLAPEVVELRRSYGCGQITASKHLMLFHSATLGYQNLTPNFKVENFGGLRPGCWINALPVGGLVLIPDASAGCSCSYQNRSWMALEGKE